jgi:hypothetical protein
MTDATTTAAPDDADLDAQAEAEVGPKAAYVEAKLAERWRAASQVDPVGTGSREQWHARVAAAYRPQLEDAWRQSVRARREALRQRRAWQCPTEDDIVRAEIELARLGGRDEFIEREVRWTRLQYHPGLPQASRDSMDGLARARAGTDWDQEERRLRQRVADVRRRREASLHPPAPPPQPVPMGPYAEHLKMRPTVPPFHMHYRPVLCLLPLTAPGATELMHQLGLTEAEVPDFGDDFYARQQAGPLPGKHLVLALGSGPNPDYPCTKHWPDTFDPAWAAEWTRKLAVRPPTEAEARAKLKLEQEAESARKALQVLRDKEQEQKRQEEERLRRNPLARIRHLEEQLRDLSGRLGDAEAAARAAELRRQLDEMMARPRGNGHQP